MKRTLLCSAFGLLLGACGGGGGGGSSAPENTAPPATPAPGALTRIDAQPSSVGVQVDPAEIEASITHFGFADLTLTLSGDCAGGGRLDRSVADLSVDFETIHEHLLRCEGLAANSTAATQIMGSRTAGDAYELTYEFSTGSSPPDGLLVVDAVTTPRASLAGAFEDYLDRYLEDELELSSAVTLVLSPVVEAIAEVAWTNLLDPSGQFDVRAERVSYASRAPDGAPDGGLSGLVAYPIGAAQPRREVIVLMHSTGVTPSDLDPANAWVILANLYASLGYLVVAPDNWGRGGTAAETETYLLGGRTAANALDLVQAVLGSATYADLFDAQAPAVHIVGYSQGGHSAVALWLAMNQQTPEIEVTRVFAGGGPYALYESVRGAARFVAGTCGEDEAFCRFVDEETSLPFVTERIVPPYVEYLDLGLTRADLLDGDALSADFVSGFLSNQSQFDLLKGALQLNSYNNLMMLDSDSVVRLTHSRFDRLVDVANAVELVSSLEGAADASLDENACNSASYATIFSLTEQVGIAHALCGLEMLDDVYEALR